MENVKNDDLYNVEVEERVFKTESLEDKASTATAKKFAQNVLGL